MNHIDYLGNKVDCISLEMVDDTAYKCFRDWSLIIDSGSSFFNPNREYEIAYIGSADYKDICRAYRINCNDRLA